MDSKTIRRTYTLLRRENLIWKILHLYYQRFHYTFFERNPRSQLQKICSSKEKNALIQHFYRVYHQIKVCCGNSTAPRNWDWILKNYNLVANKGVVDVAAHYVMEQFFCNCKKSACQKVCWCRKFGLKCTPQCGNVVTLYKEQRSNWKFALFLQVYSVWYKSPVKKWCMAVEVFDNEEIAHTFTSFSPRSCSLDAMFLTNLDRW